ncbi:hypothetical protein IQ225_09550, partial [Synechocystis salina LEGE 06155]|nr:hypothetical protein [Synechocystis salina LEGE 06155]
INSGDYADNPSFSPLNQNTHPTVKPISALVEGIERYLPNYLPKILQENKPKLEEDEKIPKDAVQKGIHDLTEFLKLAKKNVDEVIIIQHLTRTELEESKFEEGYYKIVNICEQLSINCVSLEPQFRLAIKQGADLFRDNIHVNEKGQQLIAEVILNIINNPSATFPPNHRKD